jgi:hypothetical protein
MWVALSHTKTYLLLLSTQQQIYSRDARLTSGNGETKSRQSAITWKTLSQIDFTAYRKS